MLLRFSVENFRSIKRKQELIFTASAISDEGVDVIKSDFAPKYGVLPSILLYGANASGKTNIVRAISRLQNMVLSSHAKGAPGTNLKHSFFRLDSHCKNKPTVFELDFLLNNTRYIYGFSFNSKIIISEWLISFPKKQARILFERDGMEFEFGRSLRGRNSVIRDITRPNSLFLSAAAQNGHASLTEIALYIAKMEVIDSSSTANRFSFETIMKTPESMDATIDLLVNLGTGVAGYQVKTSPISDEVKVQGRKIREVLLEAFPDVDRNELEFGEPDEVRELELKHINSQGETVVFDLDDESAGTLRLLASAPLVFDALSRGGVVVIDELDLSLHTKAAQAILELFAVKESNPHGAQLLATTHDTNLLSIACLRRDQIWFVEKDEEWATYLFPLTDIKTRKEDNIERGYLQGRFGAIPRL